MPHRSATPLALLLLLLLAPLPAAAFGSCPDTPPLLSDATIGFAGDSDDLSPAERDAVRQLAREAMQRKVAQICLYGSGEARGNAFSRSLATERAEAVAFELQMAGVPRERIEVVPSSAADSVLSGLGGDAKVDILFAP